MTKGKFYNEKNTYESLSDTFKAVVNKHAPLKEKIVRGNNAPFRTNELRKVIMNRSRLKKKYQDWPSRQNFKIGKKNQKNECNKLCRETKKYHFKNITKSNLNSNNKFWQFVKPFLTSKEVFGTDFISIKKDNQFIDNKLELVEMFNSHSINTLENMTGIPPDISSLYDLQENGNYFVKQVIKKFKNHPSIVEIKKNINIVEKFTIKEATVSDINKLDLTKSPLN